MAEKRHYSEKELAERRRISAQKYRALSNQLGLIFQDSQRNAYRKWCKWEAGVEAQEEEKTARRSTTVERLVKWITSSWQPQWAGEVVTAGDISEQEHTFPMGNGEIKIVCSWRPSHQEIPAFVKITWNANISTPGELWVRFIRPETDILLAEFRLGAHRSGEAVFSTDDLGFDPSREKWAIIILLKDIEG